MLVSSKYLSLIVSLSLILTSLGAQATQTLVELQNFKQKISAYEKAIQELDKSVLSLNDEIQKLADKRKFYQIIKTPEEKSLIATREETVKKSAASKEQVNQLKEQLRNNASEFLAQNDNDFAELRKTIDRLSPIAAQGKTAVDQLDDAAKQLGSSQVAAGLNATSSVIGAWSGQKPGALGQISAAMTQAAVNKALKAGQTGLQSAATFDSQLQELAHSNNSGILSGTLNGALGRGVIFAIITGRNPLNSNGFLLSNSMFQLSNLKAVKDKVKTALEAVSPISQGLSTELSALVSKKDQKEILFINQL